MSLLDICEPLLQYVCRLNRLGRRGGRQDWGIVRSEIKQIFADMKQKADQTPGMTGPYGEIELVLIFFTDSMILNSKLPPGWKPMSHERGELGFEEKFWDLLEDTMRDASEGATQRLSVFYACIGLGFTGLYTGQPDYIRRKMLEISSRLRGMIDADMSAKMCPEAYENVDTRNFTLPPHRSLVGVMIALAIMVAALVGGYFFVFRDATKALERDLLETNARGLAVTTPAP
jgi:type VI protein secretion system component VasF